MSIENQQKSLEEEGKGLEKNNSPEKHTTDPEHFLVHEIHNSRHDQEVAEKIKNLKKSLHAHLVEKIIPTQNTTSPEKVIKPMDTAKLLTNATDFLPIVGSLKMIIEGIRGKQYGTEKEIAGTSRILHGVSGAVFLALDATGIGTLFSELGKAGIKLSLRALEKETLAKITENTLVREEAVKLATRGENRIDRKEKIATA